MQAIFFDIDGTLVAFESHLIPDSTKEALHLLRTKGIKVFIATGRPRVLINNLGDLEFDGYITLNGSHCMTTEGEDILKRPIPADDIERLIRFQPATGIPFTFFDDASTSECDGTFITNVNDSVREMVRMHGLQLPAVRPIEDARGMNILQLNGYFSDEQAHQLHIRQEVLPHCDLTRWSPLFADIIAHGNSKENGIDHICRHYGIDLAQTMAFGDGGNDIGMLRHCKVGVAMGNAYETVKQAADYVTDSVEDNGVWNALRHFEVI